ncbi:MAG: DUF3352 domain-containing protein [Planctomycetaceae bacterium]
MRRFGMNIAWAMTMAVGLWTSAAVAYAEDDSPVGEQLLPPETLFFFSLPDVPGFHQCWQESKMGELMREPAMQPFVDKVKEKLAEQSEKLQQQVGVSLEKLLTIPQGEITFAVLELPPRKLALVLMLDYGENESTVATLLEKMDEALKEADGKSETEEVGEAKVVTYSFGDEDPQNPFTKLAYFDYDSYLVFASDPEALKSILERWKGDNSETLAAQDVFKYIVAKCSTEDQEPILKWYFNPIGTAQSVISLVQNQVPQAGLVVGFLPLLGLSELKAFGGVTVAAVDDYEGVSKGFVYVNQPTTGILNMFQATAAELAPPKWVPEDVASYAAVNWDVNRAYSAIEALYDNFQGAGSFGKVIDELADRDDGPGLHVRKDIVDQLTGQIHVIMGVAQIRDAEPEPKMTFALDVKDAKKTSSVLAKAAKMDGAPITTRDFEGAVIYDLQAGETSVSIAVVGKHLVISSDPTILENAIGPSAGVPALADNAKFKKIAEKFPQKMAAMSYQDSRGQMKVYYDLAKSGKLNLPEELNELVEKLPDFEVIAKYLRSSGVYVVPDKKGAMSVSFTLKNED